MTKKYAILWYRPDEDGMELETSIYENAYFNNKEDADRICNKLDNDAEAFHEFEVVELTPYHEKDEPYIEGAD